MLGVENLQGCSGPNGAGYRAHQHKVERRESLNVSSCTDHNDEHDAEHEARSGKEQAMRCE